MRYSLIINENDSHSRVWIKRCQHNPGVLPSGAMATGRGGVPIAHILQSDEIITGIPPDSDMFTMPSLLSLLSSTLIFFAALWYFNRMLDEQGIPKGMTRGILVLTLASIVSWGAGVAVDWAHDRLAGPPSVKPAVQAPAQGLPQ
jgi:hypothetical protein